MRKLSSDSATTDRADSTRSFAARKLSQRTPHVQAYRRIHLPLFRTSPHNLVAGGPHLLAIGKAIEQVPAQRHAKLPVRATLVGKVLPIRFKRSDKGDGRACRRCELFRSWSPANVIASLVSRASGRSSLAARSKSATFCSATGAAASELVS